MKTRRPILNAAFTSSVERRASGSNDQRTALSPSSPGARLSWTSRTGVTMIELGMVMGIISVLLALVLGLARYVDESMKHRRTQADLGEWHESLHAWYMKYGTYPDPLTQAGRAESNLVWLASTNAAAQYTATMQDGSKVPFCSLASKPLRPFDPWGTPYYYQSTTNGYDLFSCGPNRVHGRGGDRFPNDATPVPEPDTDDLHFEP